MIISVLSLSFSHHKDSEESDSIDLDNFREDLSSDEALGIKGSDVNVGDGVE